MAVDIERGGLAYPVKPSASCARSPPSGAHPTVVELDEVRAADLVFKHGLRGLDAIQLAGALSTREQAGGETFAFASFGLALNRAARSEGLTVLEPLD